MKALVYSTDLCQPAAINSYLERLTEEDWVCLDLRADISADECEHRLRELAAKRGVEVNCRDPFEKRLLYLWHDSRPDRWWHFHDLEFKNIVFMSDISELIAALQDLCQASLRTAV